MQPRTWLWSTSRRTTIASKLSHEFEIKFFRINGRTVRNQYTRIHWTDLTSVDGAEIFFISKIPYQNFENFLRSCVSLFIGDAFGSEKNLILLYVTNNNINVQSSEKKKLNVNWLLAIAFLV